jgi:hypothetical protein
MWAPSSEPTSPVTQSGLFKFTEPELLYLQSYLECGDRGGYYMALYNMTGNPQCLEQAQSPISFASSQGRTATLVL